MTDPKRLLDEASNDDLSRLLAAGKSELPDAAQLGALALKIGIASGAAGAAGAAAGGGVSAGGAGAAKASAAAGAAKAGLAFKIGGAVVIAGAATASAVAVTSTTHDAPQAPVGIVATVAAPARSSATTSNAVPTASASTTEPLPEVPSAAPSAQAIAPRPSARPLASEPSGPEAEVRLLERAQDALRSSPAQALVLADEHARRFPQGMLTQEREVIAIEALAKSGRMNEARARATKFRARFPGSSHTRRVEALVGE